MSQTAQLCLTWQSAELSEPCARSALVSVSQTTQLCLTWRSAELSEPCARSALVSDRSAGRLSAEGSAALDGPSLPLSRSPCRDSRGRWEGKGEGHVRGYGGAMGGVWRDREGAWEGLWRGREGAREGQGKMGWAWKGDRSKEPVLRSSAGKVNLPLETL